MVGVAGGEVVWAAREAAAAVMGAGMAAEEGGKVATADVGVARAATVGVVVGWMAGEVGRYWQ